MTQVILYGVSLLAVGLTIWSNESLDLFKIAIVIGIGLILDILEAILRVLKDK